MERILFLAAPIDARRCGDLEAFGTLQTKTNFSPEKFGLDCRRSAENSAIWAAIRDSDKRLRQPELVLWTRPSKIFIAWSSPYPAMIAALSFLSNGRATDTFDPTMRSVKLPASDSPSVPNNTSLTYSSVSSL